MNDPKPRRSRSGPLLRVRKRSLVVGGAASLALIALLGGLIESRVRLSQHVAETEGWLASWITNLEYRLGEAPEPSSGFLLSDAPLSKQAEEKTRMLLRQYKQALTHLLPAFHLTEQEPTLFEAEIGWGTQQSPSEVENSSDLSVRLGWFENATPSRTAVVGFFLVLGSDPEPSFEFSIAPSSVFVGPTPIVRDSLKRIEIDAASEVGTRLRLAVSEVTSGQVPIKLGLITSDGRSENTIESVLVVPAGDRGD